MGAFPTSIEQVTPAWLAEATGLPVEAVDIQQIGAGIGVMSALYRVRLSGEGCPKTVVVKLPGLAEESVFTGTVLRMYLREAAFFGELAGKAPVRVPACYHSSIDPESSEFVLVMEDLGGLRIVDQVEGMDIADAEEAVDGLAAWHAMWWGKALELAERGVTVSLGDPIYKAVLPTVFAEGWEKLSKELAIPDAIKEVGPRWSDAMPGLVDDLAAEPTTMVHGDWRADNLLFEPDGSVAALDFQLIGTARGTYDLAYFVTQSLDSAVAAKHEAALFDRWRSAVEAAGAPPEDNATAWDDYRKGALFCLVYPVVAWRGMDAGDPRQVGLATTMLERFDRAVDDLDLVALL
jgi:hypothetical protein